MTLGITEILAVALTVSQVFTKPPEQFKTKFDPVADKAEVVSTLKQGCTFLNKEWDKRRDPKDLEGRDLETLLKDFSTNAKKLKTLGDDGLEDLTQKTPTVAGEAPKSMTMKIIEKVDFDVVTVAYKVFCKSEEVDMAPLKLEAAIAKFNDVMKDLPDHKKLKGLRLPGASTILDREGNRFTEVFADHGRRTFVPLAELPPYLPKAFIAAEDQNFLTHKGVDINGVIRALMSTFKGDLRPQGGSTITQQVVKNLLVGDALSADRKMQEMVLATRVEQLLSKNEILELYMNYIYLGRASWGVEMAAKSYFDKSARDLSIVEAAFLAGLTKGPNAYNPDRFPKEAKQRLQYTIGRMTQDGAIAKGDLDPDILKYINGPDPFQIVPYESPQKRAAYYFLDEIQRDVKRKTGIESLTAGGSFVVRSTIHPRLQKIVEGALQEGLLDYEIATGRQRFEGPAGSILKQMTDGGTTWQEQVASASGNLYDLRYPIAVVLGNKMQDSKGKIFYTKDTKLGLADGSVVSLVADAKVRKALNVWDLIYVTPSDDGKSAKILIPPRVQGAIMVMEAKTGRVLAMSGGFSYGGSQLNRVTRSLRQPGSTLKPFIYLSALNAGLEPNTLIPDVPITLAPLERGAKPWTPKNFDGGSRGMVTIRQAVEKSLNLPTARVMAKLFPTPTQGLDYIRGITQEVGIYDNPIRIYPFVLGAQPTRLIDMVSAYAMISNVTAPYNPGCPLCLKPVPHFIDSVAQDGKIIWKRKRAGDEGSKTDEDGLQNVFSLDRAPIYQIRRILQGTIERGTAAAAKKDLGGFVAGKTGTSNNTVDAWFIGFTNDIVVGVWVGYDDTNVEASLGSRFTGGRVALPIAQKVFNRSFEEGVYKGKEALAGVPPDLANKVIEYPIDPRTGNFNEGNFLEVFKTGTRGGPLNTQRRILRRSELGMAISDPPSEEDVGDVQNLFDDEGVAGYQLPDSDPRGNSYRFNGPPLARPRYTPGPDDQDDGQDAEYNTQPRQNSIYQ